MLKPPIRSVSLLLAELRAEDNSPSATVFCGMLFASLTLGVFVPAVSVWVVHLQRALRLVDDSVLAR